MPPETPSSTRANASCSKPHSRSRARGRGRAPLRRRADLLLRIVQQLGQLLDPLLLDLLDVGTVDLRFLAGCGGSSGLDPGLLLLDREAHFFPGGELDLVLEDLLADQPAQAQPI